MTADNGRVSFDDAVWNKPAASKANGDKNDYIRVSEDKDYMIMLLSTAPFSFQEHWSTNASGEARSVRCAMRNCTLCAEATALLSSSDPAKQSAGKELKAKQKFAIEAYLLGTGNETLGGQAGRPGIFEFGPQIFNQIRSISNTLKKVGANIDGIILSVNRDKRRGPNGMYQVTQLPVVYKLSEEQQALLKAFQAKGLDLAKMYEAPSDEANMRRLGRIAGSEPARPAGSTVLGSAQTTGGTPFTPSW